jgi:hypothetical protein
LLELIQTIARASLTERAPLLSKLDRSGQRDGARVVGISPVLSGGFSRAWLEIETQCLGQSDLRDTVLFCAVINSGS